MIGGLLKQVTPPRRYSHAAIMTRNYYNVSHSTASDSWLEEHPVGGIFNGPLRATASSFCYSDAAIAARIDPATGRLEGLAPDEPDGGITTQWWDAAPKFGWGDHPPFPLTGPARRRRSRRAPTRRLGRP